MVAAITTRTSKMKTPNRKYLAKRKTCFADNTEPRALDQRSWNFSERRNAYREARATTDRNAQKVRGSFTA